MIYYLNKKCNNNSRRGGRVVEGARLESVYRGNSIMGSNPILSANKVKIVNLNITLIILE